MPLNHQREIGLYIFGYIGLKVVNVPSNMEFFLSKVVKLAFVAMWVFIFKQLYQYCCQTSSSTLFDFGVRSQLAKT